MSNGSRYTPTNDIGVSVLKRCIPKELGWICREVAQPDVGIDATIEQVIDGNPTAKYISVQLKTGEGNIHIDRNGNFIYYIDKTHYDYWLSSSIPVILAYCNPEDETIYWELLKKCNIKRTKGEENFKITISNTHLLNKDSLDEFNVIIDTYQTEFELPDMDEDDVCDIEYWNELLENCAETISNSRQVLDQLDVKYKRHIAQMAQFVELHKDGVDKKIVDKHIAKHAKSFKVAIDTCKMQFKSQIPIIAETHVEAIRLAERAMTGGYHMPTEINTLLQEELNKETEAIRGVKEILTLAIERFENSSSPTIDLRRAEGSFAQVLKDYSSELESIVYWIGKLLRTL
jgi:hypothetical protein